MNPDEVARGGLEEIVKQAHMVVMAGATTPPGGNMMLSTEEKEAFSSRGCSSRVPGCGVQEADRVLWARIQAMVAMQVCTACMYVRHDVCVGIMKALLSQGRKRKI